MKVGHEGVVGGAASEVPSCTMSAFFFLIVYNDLYSVLFNVRCLFFLYVHLSFPLINICIVILFYFIIKYILTTLALCHNRLNNNGGGTQPHVEAGMVGFTIHYYNYYEEIIVYQMNALRCEP